MILRLAGPGDLGAALRLRADAQQWLQAIGSDQWDPALPTSNTAEAISRSIAAGDTFVVEDVEGVGATITIDTSPDDGLWTPREINGALFVHRLIVARRLASRGVADALLNFAAQEAEERGLTWLRLDCWTSNAALRKYYLGRGFTHVRTVTDHPLPSAVCMQRRSCVRTPAAAIYRG